MVEWHPACRGTPVRAKAGGDGGIRTLDRALQPYNGLANRRLQPLGHISGCHAYARRVGTSQAPDRMTGFPIAGFCVLAASNSAHPPVRKPHPSRYPSYVDNSGPRVSADTPRVLQSNSKPFTKRGRSKWCGVALASGNSEDPRGAGGRRSASFCARARSLHPDNLEGMAAACCNPFLFDHPFRRRADRTTWQGSLAHFDRRARLAAGAGLSACRGRRIGVSPRITDCAMP